MVVLGSNFIPSPHKRWISLSPVIHLFLLVHGNSTLSSLSLRTIYLRICQTSGCWCVSYRTWNPRLSRRPFELSRESTCPGGESISAGTANFLEFSKGESISIFSNLDYRWWCQNVASYFSECEFIVWTCKHCEERSFFMEEVFLGGENRFYTVIFYIGG